jgi:hypothetical protein
MGIVRHFLHLFEAGHDDPLHIVEAIPGEKVTLPVTPGAHDVSVKLETIDEGESTAEADEKAFPDLAVNSEGNVVPVTMFTAPESDITMGPAPEPLPDARTDATPPPEIIAPAPEPVPAVAEPVPPSEAETGMAAGLTP